MKMPKHTPNFLTDASGKRVSVVLSLKDWEKLLEYIEDLEDALAYDDAKAKNDGYELLTDFLASRKPKTTAHA